MFVLKDSLRCVWHRFFENGQSERCEAPSVWCESSFSVSSVPAFNSGEPYIRVLDSAVTLVVAAAQNILFSSALRCILGTLSFLTSRISVGFVRIVYFNPEPGKRYLLRVFSSFTHSVASFSLFVPR